MFLSLRYLHFPAVHQLAPQNCLHPFDTTSNLDTQPIFEEQTIIYQKKSLKTSKLVYKTTK